MRIGIVVTCQKLDIILVIKLFENWCWYLGKILSNFVPLSWKLDNMYYHNYSFNHNYSVKIQLNENKNVATETNSLHFAVFSVCPQNHKLLAKLIHQQTFRIDGCLNLHCTDIPTPNHLRLFIFGALKKKIEFSSWFSITQRKQKMS